MTTDINAMRGRCDAPLLLTAIRSADPIRALEQLAANGDLPSEVLAMRGCEQNRHHDHDVWGHAIAALREALQLVAKGALVVAEREGAPSPVILRDAFLLAAFLHDVGKPPTRRREGGDYTFHAHDVVGSNIVRRILRGADPELVAIVAGLVRLHMFGTQDCDGETLDDRAARRLIRCGAEEQPLPVQIWWDLQMMLRRADALGKGSRGRWTPDDHNHRYAAIVGAEIKRANQPPPTPPPITGEQLIAMGAKREEVSIGLGYARAIAAQLKEVRENDAWIFEAFVFNVLVKYRHGELNPRRVEKLRRLGGQRLPNLQAA